MDRQTWLEARRKGIGGTDAAAILGLSRWRTAVDVYEDKVGIAPEKPQTAAMVWGLALEAAIADAYTVETGRRVRKVGIRRAHHVKDYPMIGSIDRETYLGRPEEEPRVVELKTSRSSDGFADRDGWRDVIPEKRVPADYYVQVQHYLEVADRSIADVAVLFGGSDFRIYEIPRDREYGADLRTEEGAFWRDYVLTETYPPASADDLANLGRRFGSSTDDEKVATPEVALLVDAYLELDGAVDLAEQQRDEVKAKLMEAMGTTGRLVAPGAVVSWRSHDRKTTSWKDYAGVLAGALEVARLNDPAAKTAIDRVLSEGVGTTDLADVVGLYSATSSVRPFRVDRKNEGGSK